MQSTRMTDGRSTARLYGGTIAVVSGAYSLVRGTGGEMLGSDWVMLLLGAIVLVHGIVLFASTTALAGASGPLMVGYSVLMLGNQLWMATSTPMGTGMNGSMGMTGTGIAGGYDLGMVAIAIIMLASGIIMMRRDGM